MTLNVIFIHPPYEKVLQSYLFMTQESTFTSDFRADSTKLQWSDQPHRCSDIREHCPWEQTDRLDRPSETDATTSGVVQSAAV